MLPQKRNILPWDQEPEKKKKEIYCPKKNSPEDKDPADKADSCLFLGTVLLKMFSDQSL